MRIKKLHFKTIVPVLLILMAFIPACKKGSPDTSLLVLDFHPLIGNDSISMNTTYPNTANRNVSISRASFYVSDIALTRTDGSVDSLTVRPF